MNSNISIIQRESSTGSIRLSAQEEGKEIGHAYLYLIQNDLHKTPYALVEDLGVNEVCRGKGVARMLMLELHRLAKESECYKIIANSHEKRDAAKALYTSLGYRTHATEFRLDLT